MIEIKGKYNTARCYCAVLEASAAQQIQAVCDCEAFSSCKIRIMPDVHTGKGCTIGTTMTVIDKVVPGMVGVDIGCGMETVYLKDTETEFSELDRIIRMNIPSGRSIRKKLHEYAGNIKLENLKCADKVDVQRAYNSIGTLGGGNHFIEIDRADNGGLYLIVHSGSRHLGKEVAEYYQSKGYKALAASGKTDIPRELAYVEGRLFEDYIYDMRIVQQFATLNRRAMTEIILSQLGLTEQERFTTIHNYIDTDNMVLRKGSVSAGKGERLLIPINMRDGSLICIGKGNADWNCSAPHGAGRLMSRTEAQKILSMEKYREEMQGVFTTCVNRKTLDESPMAYKNMDEILEQIVPTAEVAACIKPVYNFKAAE